MFFQGAEGHASAEHDNPSESPSLAEYFGGSLDDNPVYSTADVADSALLENLSFSHSKAMPADITIVQNAEFAWKTKEFSLGFSGRVLGSQERARMCDYWVEFLEKYETICKELSSPLGFHVVPADYKLVIEKIKTGYTFIAFSLDTIFLGTQCRSEMNKLKKYKNVAQVKSESL